MNIGDFVVANPVTFVTTRFGIVTQMNGDGSFVILAESGKVYLCKGSATIVTTLWPDTQKFVDSWRQANM